MILRPRIRNIRRFREIIRVFSRYGFHIFFRGMRVFDHLPWSSRKRTRHNPPQVNFRMALEELGTTYIKLGQILSSRIDLLPEEFCRELKKLRDDAPPVEFSKIREVLEKELKKPLTEIFTDIEPVPLASASIAQVHRATLTDGTKVAIKVQKPRVDEEVHSDLEILGYFTSLASRLHIFPENVSVQEVFLEFRKILLREIDFLYEAINARKFKENFENFEGVYIPAVYPEYTTPRVLIMELIEGQRPTNIGGRDLEHINGHSLAVRGVEAVLKMVFEDGFFHADPHPGNVMVREKSGDLVFLDFGMVGAIDRETRENMVRMLLAALEKDSSRVVGILEEEFLLSPLKSSVALRIDLNEVLERYITADLSELNLRDLINDFFYLLRKHQLRFPANLSAMLRALIVAEGTGMELDPQFTIAPYLARFLRRTIMRFFNFENISRRALNYTLDWRKLAEEFPEKTYDIMTQLASGRFNVNFESRDIDNLNKKLETVSSRISLSVILGSLLIGSSLIYSSFPGLRPVGFLGITGYVIAAVLGITLVIELFRHH